MKCIIYATDGSPAALSGAYALACLPLQPGCRVTLLNVAAGYTSLAEVFGPPQRILEGTEAVVEQEVRSGHSVEQILAAAEEQQADLIVLGSTGRSAVSRLLLGSVATGVVRNAPCSVLLAKPMRSGLRHVLLGYDGSPTADYATEFLQALPLPSETHLTVVTAANLGHLGGGGFGHSAVLARELQALQEGRREEALQQLANVKARFEQDGRHTDTLFSPSDAATALLETAEEQDADLIVVGSKGLTGFERFLLGSVAEKVIHHAHCSVLVIRKPAVASMDQANLPPEATRQGAAGDRSTSSQGV